MKITIKDQEQKEIRLEDLRPGTIFQYKDGAVGLRGKEIEDTFLLRDEDGEDWFAPAIYHFDKQVERVIGKIDEIIVVSK